MTKDEIKKKRRMLKNRQSASLSRKRKKEYLEGLETKNASLFAENNKLKTKLSSYSQQRSEPIAVWRRPAKQLQTAKSW